MFEQVTYGTDLYKGGFAICIHDSHRYATAPLSLYVSVPVSVCVFPCVPVSLSIFLSLLVSLSVYLFLSIFSTVFFYLLQRYSLICMDLFSGISYFYVTCYSSSVSPRSLQHCRLLGPTNW